MKLFAVIFLWFNVVVYIMGFGMELGKDDTSWWKMILNVMFAIGASIAAIGVMR